MNKVTAHKAEQTRIYSLEDFAVHIERRRLEDWVEVARLVARGLDHLPVGTSFTDAKGRRHTKIHDDGLDWRSEVTSLRLMRGGPDKGKMRRETHCSQGFAWNFGLEVGTKTGKPLDMALIEIAYRGLLDAGEMLTHPAPQNEEPAAVVAEEKKPASKPKRSRKPKAPPPPSREQCAALIAATLPDTEGELMEAAKQALEAYHAAVMASDEAAASQQEERYEAAIFKLNGNSFFASFGERDAPGYRIADYCAAEDGAVPMWGQKGRFLIEVNGVRALCEYKGFSDVGKRIKDGLK
ncbi:hypothetical protein [Telmatospirillum sp. J64-1]|uniref:hypothetical protein n=1 Tax=Telmatospirillum sp. J64-1 TaxID=2502183 RepID=UPI00115F1D79|nr:hypothetical protein [Telmatospirillum sp. J64-1]